MNKTQKQECQTCKQQFDAEVLQINGRDLCLQNLCDPCLEKAIEEQGRNAAKTSAKARESFFWDMIPPMYQSTDESRLDARLRAAIDAYSFNEKGLGFVGTSGAGKTRAMITLLKRLNIEGKSVSFLKSTRLTEIAYQRFDEDPKIKQAAKAEIDAAKSRACLLIDDIGKGRLPNSAEELLFDIVDTRSEMGLPLFWTANATKKDLHAAFTPDRADPIIRRLVEFGQIVSV